MFSLLFGWSSYYAEQEETLHGRQIYWQNCYRDNFVGKISNRKNYVKEASGDLHRGKSQSKSHNGPIMALCQSQSVRTTYHKEVLTEWHKIFAGFCDFCVFFQWSVKQRKGSAKNISSKNLHCKHLLYYFSPISIKVQRTCHGKSFWTV